MKLVLHAPYSWLSKAALWLSVLCGGWISGCNDPLPPTLPQARVRLTQVLRLYTAYSDKHRKGPPNEQALRDFREKMTAAEREASLLAEDVGDIFTSPRDNQKFEVRYNLRINPGENKAVAWEAKGEDGKRFVALTMGYVEEYDEQSLAEYKKR